MNEIDEAEIDEAEAKFESNKFQMATTTNRLTLSPNALSPSVLNGVTAANPLATLYCGRRGLHAGHIYQPPGSSQLICPGTHTVSGTPNMTGPNTTSSVPTTTPGKKLNDGDPETRLFDRYCRCGKRADETATGCQWHASVSARYAKELAAALEGAVRHVSIMLDGLGVVPSHVINEEP